MNRLCALLLLVSTLLVSTYARAETRVALVIGNSHYASVDVLPNPGRDATLMAETLKSEGFTVTLVQDATRTTMLDALNAFNDQADRADWALVYYAGHGMEVGGTNYLLPTDARLRTDRDVQDETVSLPRVQQAVANARKLRLIIIDACRNNLFVSPMRHEFAERAVSRGLARPEPDAGTIVVYAAEAGAVADDGAGDHSPFTAALVKRLEQPGLEVSRLFNAVAGDVMHATANHQRPYMYGSIPGDEEFYFIRRAPIPAPPSRDDNIWSFLKTTKDIVGLTAFRDGLPPASPLRGEVEAYTSNLKQSSAGIGSLARNDTTLEPNQNTTTPPKTAQRTPILLELQDNTDVLGQDIRERAYFYRVMKDVRADQDRVRERADAELLMPFRPIVIKIPPIVANPSFQFSLKEQSSAAKFEAATRAEQVATDSSGTTAKALMGQTDSAAAGPTITVAHRAALLVDAPEEAQKVKTYVGTVVWHLDSVSPGQGQPLATAIKADIDIPDAKLKVTMLMQKNPEARLPASHTIEFHFLPQDGNTLGPIKQVNVPEMRKDDDTPRGDPLAGVPVAITDDYFLVGLTRGAAEAQNTRLMTERNWFDMSLLFTSGKIGKLTFEKGAASQRVFDDFLRTNPNNAPDTAAASKVSQPPSDAHPVPPSLVDPAPQAPKSPSSIQGQTPPSHMASLPEHPPEPGAIQGKVDALRPAPAPGPFPDPKKVKTFLIRCIYPKGSQIASCK